MAWKGRDKDIELDFAQLLSSLNNSRIQTENNALYQVIYQLVLAAQKNKDLTVEEFKTLENLINNLAISITTINSLLKFATFITAADETVNLPASLQALAGAGIVLDYSVPNKVTISSTGGGGSGSSSSVFDLLGDVDSFSDPIIPISGPSGPQGPTGASGNNTTNQSNINDNLDSSDPFTDPFIPSAGGGTSTTNNITNVTNNNVSHLSDLLNDADDYGLIPLSGAKGDTGATGPSGTGGSGGTSVYDNIDNEDFIPIVSSGSTGATGATGIAGKDGIQPDVLITLCARLLRRLKFLEESAGAYYLTDDLINNTVPTDTELLSFEIDGLVPSQGNVALTDSFGITIDGGGSVITTGFKGVRPLPYSGVITSVSIYCGDGLTGSIAIDIYKGLTPILTSANSIVGNNKPTISSSTSYLSSALSGIAFNAGDIFGFNVDSVSTFTRVTLTINIRYNQQLF